MTGALATAAADLDKAIADAKAAQASGDFAKYGQALQALDAAMTRFQEAQKAAAGQQTPASTPPSAPASGPPSVPPSTPPTAGSPSPAAGG
jgi:hypothetical protein